MTYKISNLEQAFAATALALLLSTVAIASETDQFHDRGEPLADSTEVLNAKVNRKISKIAASRQNSPDQFALAYQVYHELGGFRMTDRLERWLVDSPEVKKRRVPLGKSIYGDMPIWSTRMVNVLGLGKTISVNGELIGTDKISHFMSQGWKYYKRYRKYDSEAKAAERAVLTERAIFGAGSTGSFSNADLVSNYEGHRFYRSLFEDEIIPGKPAILRWEKGVGWIMQREFDWADHVNAYWDEALNMNSYDALLRDRMEDSLIDLCPEYWQEPGLYSIDDEEQLRSRYAHLGMRETRHMRLDNLCLAHEPRGGDSIVAANINRDNGPRLFQNFR